MGLQLFHQNDKRIEKMLFDNSDIFFAFDHPISFECTKQSNPRKIPSTTLRQIKPTGWLEIQMQKKMEGFIGILDKPVPDLINDPI